MQVEGYDLRVGDESLLEFEFDDVGVSGTFPMAIDYSPFSDFQSFPELNPIYNLAFGVVTVREDGSKDLDDEVNTKNGTLTKVIATVAQTLFVFWDVNPGVTVYITGSNQKRTNLYHKVLVNHYQELPRGVNVYGVGLNGEGTERMKSYYEKAYKAFLIQPPNKSQYEEHDLPF